MAIAKLGGDVSFLGAVGNDANADVLLTQLQESAVVFKGRKWGNVPTGIAMITVVGDDNFIVLHPGANEKLTPEEAEKQAALIAESDYCVMQLEIPLETVLKVCEIAKKSGTKLALNPAPYRKLPRQLLESVDYLIPNEREAEDITGICPDSEENCQKAIWKLQEMGVKNVIITL